MAATPKTASSKAVPPPRHAEADELVIRAAQEQLAEVQKQRDAGVVSFEELARAERDLAVAKARGDATAMARAHLRFTEQMLAEARKLQNAGVISQAELRKAEADYAVALAEARGDKVAVAQATLTFADWTLEQARKQHEAGIISSSQLRRAEADRAQAELALKRALENQQKDQ